MAQASSRPVKRFSIGFDDTPVQRAAVREDRRRAIPHRNTAKFVVTPNAVDVLPILARHYGEPFADSSAIPSYYLAKLTRQHVTVALNGDGGDEAFAGYGWHLASRLVGAVAPRACALRRAVTGVVSAAAPFGAIAPAVWRD